MVGSTGAKDCIQKNGTPVECSATGAYDWEAKCAADTGHPYECLGYAYKTDDTTIYTSYVTPTGAYIAYDYSGPSCSYITDEKGNMKNIKCYNSSSCSEDFCKNKSNHCIGLSAAGDTSNLDERIDQKTCIMRRIDTPIMGTGYAPGLAKIKEYKGSMYVRIDYGPYLPWPVNGYAAPSTSHDVEQKNVLDRFPPDKILTATPACLIGAIEISTADNGNVLRFSGLYYTRGVDKMDNNMYTFGYNEEVGKIDLDEFHRRDIYADPVSQLGDSNIKGTLRLFQGTYQDSFLCGIWYKIDPSKHGRRPVSGFCLVFRRFFDTYETEEEVASKTEYVGIDSNHLIYSRPSGSYWVGQTCPKYQFINQLEVGYLDGKATAKTIGKDEILLMIKNPILIPVILFGGVGMGLKKSHEEVEGKISDGSTAGDIGGTVVASTVTFVLAYLIITLYPIIIILLPLVVTIGYFGGIIKFSSTPPFDELGFKGISRFTSILYDVPDDKRSLHRTWAKNITDLRCCQLLASEQYDIDSIERYICRNIKNLKIDGTFPNYYPNQPCKVILEEKCNNKENIDTDLCKVACSLIGQDSINCDTGINDYCTGDDFEAVGMDGKYHDTILTRIKEDICSCTYKESTPDAYKNITGVSQLDNFIDSYKFLLNKKLTREKEKILDNFRLECTFGSCAKSKYKLYDQKIKLGSTPCNNTEKCLGNGYQIPNTINNDTAIGCKTYINSSECLPELEPTIGIITDGLRGECRTLIEGSRSIDDLRVKPQECILSTKAFPPVISIQQKIKAIDHCVMRVDENGRKRRMLKQSYPVIQPSLPMNDPDLCPPFKRDANGNILKDNSRMQRDVWIPCPIVPTIPPVAPPTNTRTKILYTILVVIAIYIVYKKIIANN